MGTTIYNPGESAWGGREHATKQRRRLHTAGRRAPLAAAHHPPRPPSNPPFPLLSSPLAGDWALCGPTSRGIKKVPHAVPFPTALRPTAQPSGSAASVPFHYLPPPLLNREPTTMAKNAPKVPFSVSTRESWQRVHAAASSTPAAGPGAYDVVRGMLALSTAHKTTSDGSFATARREAGNDVVRMATDAGPGSYAMERAVDFTKPRMGNQPIGRAARWLKAHNADFPAPRAYAPVEKHVPHMPFPTGRGHTMEPADPVTAAVPIRDCQRLPKHKPCASFGKAPRVF